MHAVRSIALHVSLLASRWCKSASRAAGPTCQSLAMEIQMAKSTTKIGRSAKTGRFTTVKKAQQQKNTHVVETIKKPK